MIDPCEFLQLDHCSPSDGCCTDKAGIELLGNTTLRDEFSDRAVVRRVLGDLWFTPNYGSIASAPEIAQWNTFLSNRAEFLGLRVGEINSQSATAPLYDIWDPGFDDLSEGQWKKTWQNETHGTFDFEEHTNTDWSFNLSLPASDVHTTGSTIPGAKACSSLASGSGQICIDTSIDCNACVQGVDAGSLGWTVTRTRTALTWHVHIDVKKRIPLRENQLLYLVYNKRHYDPTPPPATNSFTAIRGNVRTLVEMG